MLTTWITLNVEPQLINEAKIAGEYNSYCMQYFMQKQVLKIILSSFVITIVFFAIVLHITYAVTNNSTQQKPSVEEKIIITPLEDGFRLDISPTPLPSVTPSLTLRPTSTPEPELIPTPTPLPAFPPLSTDQINHWIKHYSGFYSVSEDLLKKIAVCESKLDPKAQNGPYGGMFQFSTSSWKSTRGFMNLDPNPTLRFNAEEAIKTAAFKISISGPGAWPNCAK